MKHTMIHLIKRDDAIVLLYLKHSVSIYNIQIKLL